MTVRVLSGAAAEATLESILGEAWSALNRAVRFRRETEGDTVIADAGLIAQLHLVAVAQRGLANVGEPIRLRRELFS